MGEDFRKSSPKSAEIAESDSPGNAVDSANCLGNTPNNADASLAEEPIEEQVEAETRELLPHETAEAEPAREEEASPVSYAEFKALAEEKEDLYDRLLRKHAEFENFRKRTEKEKQEFYDFALANFLKELLPVVDGLERGLYAPDGQTVEGYKKGIELILRQLRDVLAAAGLQPIRAIGRIFDPNFHQAVIQEENSSLAENEIIEELLRGYTFKERLLRPSMVKVAISSAPTKPADPSDRPEEAEE